MGGSYSRTAIADHGISTDGCKALGEILGRFEMPRTVQIVEAGEGDGARYMSGHRVYRFLFSGKASPGSCVNQPDGAFSMQRLQVVRIHPARQWLPGLKLAVRLDMVVS